MKKLSDYTTTELLLIAQRANVHVFDEEVYQLLCNEAKAANYANCIDFAEDLRFKRLLEVYKEKRQRFIEILESRKDVLTEEETKYKTELFTVKRTVDSHSLREPLGTITNPSNLFSFQIKHENNNSVAQTMPHNQYKQSKIFYKQMTDEEREIDDFLDKLQERNDLKIKSKNLVRNSVASGRDGPSVFNFIVEKVTNKKGVKDKNLWPSEFRVILDRMKTDVDLEFEFSNEMQLIQVCLPILMKLQQSIFDRKKLDRAIFYKKLIISFFDFYRK